MHRYSEEIIRHDALNDEGKYCEVLERVTYERLAEGADAGKLVVVNRRFDLRTGECLSRLSDNEFQQDDTGGKVRLDPAAPAADAG
jgi:hypothetical protein